MATPIVMASEYERQRQTNIERNEACLAFLGLSGGPLVFSAPKRSNPPKKRDRGGQQQRRVSNRPKQPVNYLYETFDSESPVPRKRRKGAGRKSSNGRGRGQGSGRVQGIASGRVGGRVSGFKSSHYKGVYRNGDKFYPTLYPSSQGKERKGGNKIRGHSYTEERSAAKAYDQLARDNVEQQDGKWVNGGKMKNDRMEVNFPLPDDVCKDSGKPLEIAHVHREADEVVGEPIDSAQLTADDDEIGDELAADDDDQLTANEDDNVIRQPISPSQFVSTVEGEEQDELAQEFGLSFGEQARSNFDLLSQFADTDNMVSVEDHVSPVFDSPGGMGFENWSDDTNVVSELVDAPVVVANTENTALNKVTAKKVSVSMLSLSSTRKIDLKSDELTKEEFTLENWLNGNLDNTKIFDNGLPLYVLARVQQYIGHTLKTIRTQRRATIRLDYNLIRACAFPSGTWLGQRRLVIVKLWPHQN